jgi:hypothetical protein
MTSNEKQKHRPRGAITLQLSAVNPTEASKNIVDNALQDISHSGVDRSAGAADSEAVQFADATAYADPAQSDFSKALENVVSKLDIFVQLLDKAAKVRFFIDIITDRV